MATSGIDFVIQVNTGDEITPVWTTIAGQRGATLNRSVDVIDVTSKSSDNWEENLPGIRHWSIDFDGLLVEDDTGYLELEDAFMNGTQVRVQMETVSGNKYTGMATLTDFPIEAPYDDAATYSGTLQGSGPLVKTP